MKYFINYASGGFFNSQSFGLKSAESFSFNVKGYTDRDIDDEFKSKNKNIFYSKRGAGYWIWKPYIILDMMSKINYGDYLIYMDSGANLIKDPSYFLEQIDDHGIIGFTMKQKTSMWTKGDCFYEVNSNKNYDFGDRDQIQATYIFFKKNDFSIDFVSKWLSYCTKENLITDSENLYLQNLPDFVDHRHDQSIFSLLCYNSNIKIVPQIDQYCVEHGLTLERKYVNRHGIRN